MLTHILVILLVQWYGLYQTISPAVAAVWQSQYTPAPSRVRGAFVEAPWPCASYELVCLNAAGVELTEGLPGDCVRVRAYCLNAAP